MKRPYLIVVFTIAFLLMGCLGASSTPTSAPAVKVLGTPVSVDGGSYLNVSVTELQTMLDNKDFTLLNVHTPFEGDIPGTDLDIAYDQVPQIMGKLPDKSAKIVLYCRSGRMSDIAARELVAKGYTNIWNLTGGMAAWEQAGQPIDR